MGAGGGYLMPASCHHTHPDNRPCGSPTVTGSPYCFHHARPRKPTPARPRRAFALPPLTDRKSIQAASRHILDAVARNKLDAHRATTMLYALQIAANVTPRTADDTIPPSSPTEPTCPTSPPR